jgi:2-polyprenyl-3-methyl-5-hydroxy-6-metoxy-1,4-benzoquinol methylase
MNVDQKLSKQEYWDNVLSAAKLPRINSRSTYNYRVTMDFVDSILAGNNYKTFLEVGCGSSGWLPYFAKKYNFKVSGIDYSEAGCRICEENLRIQGIDYDEIICKDLFEIDKGFEKKYDVIFSYGVIEHFKNADEVVAIMKSLLNKGGIMITLVPNLNGIVGAISKTFLREIYDMHIVFTEAELKSVHASNNMEVVKSNFVGMFTPAVIPFANSKNRLFRSHTWGKLILKSVSAVNKAFTFLYKVIPVNWPSKLYSPYIICIAKAR